MQHFTETECLACPCPVVFLLQRQPWNNFCRDRITSRILNWPASSCSKKSTCRILERELSNTLRIFYCVFHFQNLIFSVGFVWIILLWKYLLYLLSNVTILYQKHKTKTRAEEILVSYEYDFPEFLIIFSDAIAALAGASLVKWLSRQ